MRDILFAMIWVVLFPTSLFSSLSAILLWIWVALATPNLVLYDLFVEVPFNKLVAGATVVALFFQRDKKDFYFDATIALGVLFVICATISNNFGLLQFDYGDRYSNLLKIFALVVAMTGILHTRPRLYACVVAVVISVAFTGAFEAAAYIVSGGGHKVVGSGALGDNNGVAAAMVMTIPLVFYLYEYSAERRIKLAFGALLIAFVITVVATTSRGGAAGLMVLAITLFINTRQKFKLGLFYLAAAIVLYILVGDEWLSKMDTIKEADQNGSFMGRVVAWKISLLMALDNPLTGGGFNAVAVPDIWYKYYGSINTIGFIDTTGIEQLPLVAHSIFFQTLGDMGFPGFLCFLSLLATCLLKCAAIIRRCRKRTDMVWAADMARMLQISVVVYMATGALLSIAYFEIFWVLMAIISRLDRTSRQLVDPDKPMVYAGEAVRSEVG